MNKSVSITHTENERIINSLVIKYNRIAIAKHPDKDFRANISKQIYIKALEKLTPYRNKEIDPFLQSCVPLDFKHNIAKITFPEDLTIRMVVRIEYWLGSRILSLCTTEHNTLETFDISTIDNSKNTSSTIIIPFVNNTIDIKDLTDEILTAIRVHNDKMEYIYDPLQAQLELMVSTIKKCKSTKMFEAKFPALTSLYPGTIVDKLRRKNQNYEANMSSDQLALQQASNLVLSEALLPKDKDE